MKCPNCDETLLMTHRNNIEIDYCPSCRGVWLDRGELDKMLEYESQPSTKPTEDRVNRQEQNYRDQYYDRDNNYKRHKKKSFLGDLFDFD